MILEHRKMAEHILQRELESDELVHHIDERKWNNCPFNLGLTTRIEHRKERYLPIMQFLKKGVFNVCDSS